MDRDKAKKILEMAKAANAERWYVRRPTPEMMKQFGEQGLHPFIEQRKIKGEVTGVEILAEDYSGNDELREAHIAFIMAGAESLAELAQYFLDAEDAKDDRAGIAFEKDLNS